MHRCECSICNVTKMLHDLEWPSLQQRYQQSWLIVIYKIFSQLVEIDSSNTRFYNSQTIQPSCNNCVLFANVFFPQTMQLEPPTDGVIKLWNHGLIQQLRKVPCGCMAYSCTVRASSAVWGCTIYRRRRRRRIWNRKVISQGHSA